VPGVFDSELVQGIAQGFSAGAGDAYGEDLHGLGAGLGRVEGCVEGVVEAVFEGGHCWGMLGWVGMACVGFVVVEGPFGRVSAMKERRARAWYLQKKVVDYQSILSFS
jgi:hypothetical protein